MTPSSHNNVAIQSFKPILIKLASQWCVDWYKCVFGFLNFKLFYFRWREEAPSLSPWNCRSPWDPSLPEVYWASHPQAPLPASRSWDCSGFQDWPPLPERCHRSPAGIAVTLQSLCYVLHKWISRSTTRFIPTNRDCLIVKRGPYKGVLLCDHA